MKSDLYNKGQDMKRISLIMIVSILWMLSLTTYAQDQAELTCGDVLADQFSSNQSTHDYTIDVENGTRLIIHGDPLPLDKVARLSIEIQNSRGAIISENSFAPADNARTIETAPILSAGTYSIEVKGRMGGAYQLFVSCVTDDGEVISENNLIQSLACGEEIDNTMIRRDELHRYYLILEEDTIADIFLESLYGRFGEMTFEMGLYSPSNQELNRLTERFKDIDSQILEQNIITAGLYRLYIKGFDSSDEDYRLAVDCTLPDGGLALSNGDNRRVFTPTLFVAPESSESVAEEADEVIVAVAEAVESVEDSEDETPVPAQPAELPPPQEGGSDELVALEYELIEGLANTGQLTDTTPIVVYSFEGVADESVTLKYNRMRGESAVEMWLRAPSGDIIFNTSLDTTYALDALTTLPDDGLYRIFLTLGGEMDVVFTLEVERPQ